MSIFGTSTNQQNPGAELVDPPADSISCLAFSPVADLLAVGSWDCSVSFVILRFAYQ